MIDRTSTVERLRAFLESQGMVRVRADRYALTTDPPHGSFNLEIGTVYGEVRVRINDGGEQIGTVDIRSEAHLVNAYKRLETVIKKGQGMKWEKGLGWVEAWGAGEVAE